MKVLHKRIAYFLFSLTFSSLPNSLWFLLIHWKLAYGQKVAKKVDKTFLVNSKFFYRNIFFFLKLTLNLSKKIQLHSVLAYKTYLLSQKWICFSKKICLINNLITLKSPKHRFWRSKAANCETNANSSYAPLNHSVKPSKKPN